MQNIKLAYPVNLQIVLCLKEHESEWDKDSSVLKWTFHGTHQYMGTFKQNMPDCIKKDYFFTH